MAEIDRLKRVINQSSELSKQGNNAKALELLLQGVSEGLPSSFVQHDELTTFVFLTQ
jgi:hypothetical protein